MSNLSPNYYDTIAIGLLKKRETADEYGKRAIDNIIALSDIYLAEAQKQGGKPYLIRTPLIPNITDTKENLKQIEKIIGNSDWEKLPYNDMAGAKYKMLGMDRW